jgi:hypothetical protein
MGLCGDLAEADLSAFTGRAVRAFALARDADDRAVTTANLLDGLIAEGGNLAPEVLRGPDRAGRIRVAAGGGPPGDRPAGAAVEALEARA